MKKSSSLGIFLKYFKPHKGLLFVDFFCASLSAVISIAFPLLIDYALNTSLVNKQMNEFFVLAVIVIASYLVNAGLVFLVGYYGHILGVRVEADIRVDLFSHIQKLSFHFYDKTRTGSLMSRVTTDLFEITELAHHGSEDAIICTLTIIGSSIAMFYLNWRMALCVILIIICSILFIFLRRKKMMKTSASAKEKMADITSEIETSISGIRVTKSFANEDFENERFRKSNSKFQGAKREFYREFSIFAAGMDFVRNAMKICVVLVGGILYINGQATFANIITFNLFIMVLLMPIQKLVGFSEIYFSGIAGFKRFLNIMSEEPEPQDNPNAITLEHTEGNIAFKNVTFGYDPDSPVLHGIDLNIKSGETLALVGPSGAGKTSICQLIPRFYVPQSGTITLDGQDISDITLHSLRKNIGIVQQDVFIFSDTIMENIRYGSNDKTKEEIIQAAKMAEIHDDIMEMENGYDTYVGEKGAMLSGGQKQRLSIARMFLKNPPIIILDEATSALDSVTEHKIQGAIDRLSKGHTMIVIAHRLSTIRNADVIAVVSNGKISESGSHDDLVSRGGEYASLHSAQYK